MPEQSRICPTCGKRGLNLLEALSHVCDPLWWIFVLPEDPEGAWEQPQGVYAPGPRVALEKWVRQFDLDTAGEWGLTRGETLKVRVFSSKDYVLACGDRLPHEINWLEVKAQDYEVTGEYVPEYYIKPITEPPKPDGHPPGDPQQ